MAPNDHVPLAFLLGAIARTPKPAPTAQALDIASLSQSAYTLHLDTLDDAALRSLVDQLESQQSTPESSPSAWVPPIAARGTAKITDGPRAPPSVLPTITGQPAHIPVQPKGLSKLSRTTPGQPLVPPALRHRRNGFG